MNQTIFNGDNGPVIDNQVIMLKKKMKTYIPLTIICIAIIILVANSFYTLDTKEKGVLLRLGKISRVVEDAGLHFKIPFIDQVKKVNVSAIYNMEYGFRTLKEGNTSSAATYSDRDEESLVIVDGANNNASIALIELIIQYRVSNPVDYLFKVDDVDGTLRLALEEVVRSSVQSFTLNEAKTQKESIDAAIMPALQKKLNDYNTGLEILLVGTQNVQFLPSVEEAYQQKENANQYKNGKIEDGEKYQNTVVPQAQAQARKIVEEANGYAATVKAEANASVSQFLALYEEYKNYPEILREQYYLEAMSEFLKNNKIVIDLSEDGNIHKFFNFDDNVVKQSVIN